MTYMTLLLTENCLDVALDREVDGDLILNDIGSGLPFRAGSFDGAIRFIAELFQFQLFVWIIAICLFVVCQ